MKNYYHEDYLEKKRIMHSKDVFSLLMLLNIIKTYQAFNGIIFLIRLTIEANTPQINAKINVNIVKIIKMSGTLVLIDVVE